MEIKTPRASQIPIKEDRIRQWIPITLILLLAAGLYLYQLGTESLWIDEIFSIRDAKRELSDYSLNRPLYFLLLRFWMLFGTSEAWLRGLSVLFGLGSVFLIYLLGCRLSGKTTGLIAALLLTLSPLAIDLSQEVRMYMLSTCLGLGGTLALTRVFESPKISWVSWWISLRCLAVLTTPINILLLLPDFVLLGFRFRKQLRYLLVFRKWFWLVGILVIPSAVILADVVPPLWEFLEKKIGLTERPGIIAFVGGLTRFTVWPLKTHLDLAWFDEHFFNFYAAMLMCLLGVALFNKQRSVKLFWTAAWAFLPLAVIFCISQAFTTLWGLNRYLVFAAPYVLILLAGGFVRVWSWRRAVALLVAVIYAIAVSGALVRYYTVQYRTDFRGVAQTIGINEKPDDAIALFPNNYLPALDYYYHGAAPIYTIERLPKEKLFKSIGKPFVEQMLSSLPLVKSRLWLIFAFDGTGFNNKNRAVQTVIDEQFNVETHQIFSGIELFLVKPRSAFKPRKDS